MCCWFKPSSPDNLGVRQRLERVGIFLQTQSFLSSVMHTIKHNVSKRVAANMAEANVRAVAALGWAAGAGKAESTLR